MSLPAFLRAKPILRDNPTECVSVIIPHMTEAALSRDRFPHTVNSRRKNRKIFLSFLAEMKDKTVTKK